MAFQSSKRMIYHEYFISIGHPDRQVLHKLILMIQEAAVVGRQHRSPADTTRPGQQSHAFSAQTRRSSLWMPAIPARVTWPSRSIVLNKSRRQQRLIGAQTTALYPRRCGRFRQQLFVCVMLLPTTYFRLKIQSSLINVSESRLKEMF